MDSNFLNHINKKLRVAITKNQLRVIAPETSNNISLKEKLRLSFKYGVAFKHLEEYEHPQIRHTRLDYVAAGIKPVLPRGARARQASPENIPSGGGGNSSIPSGGGSKAKPKTPVQRSRAKIKAELANITAQYNAAKTDEDRLAILGTQYKVSKGKIVKIPKSEQPAAVASADAFTGAMKESIVRMVMTGESAEKIATAIPRLHQLQLTENIGSPGKGYKMQTLPGGLVLVYQVNQRGNKIKGTEETIDINKLIQAHERNPNALQLPGNSGSKVIDGATGKVVDVSGTGDAPTATSSGATSTASTTGAPAGKKPSRGTRSGKKPAENKPADANDEQNATATAVANATTPAAKKPGRRTRAGKKPAENKPADANDEQNATTGGAANTAPTTGAPAGKKPGRGTRAGKKPAGKKPADSNDADGSEKLYPINGRMLPKYNFEKNGELSKEAKAQIRRDVKAAREGSPDKEYQSVFSVLRNDPKRGDKASKIRAEIKKAQKEYEEEQERLNPDDYFVNPARRATSEETQAIQARAAKRDAEDAKRQASQRQISEKIRDQQLDAETPGQRQFRMREGISITKIPKNKQDEYDRIGEREGSLAGASQLRRLQEQVAKMQDTKPPSLVQSLQRLLKQVFEPDEITVKPSVSPLVRERQELDRLAAIGTVRALTDAQIMAGKPALFQNQKEGSIGDIINKIRVQLQRTITQERTFLEMRAATEARVRGDEPPSRFALPRDRDVPPPSNTPGNTPGKPRRKPPSNTPGNAPSGKKPNLLIPKPRLPAGRGEGTPPPGMEFLPGRVTPVPISRELGLAISNDPNAQPPQMKGGSSGGGSANRQPLVNSESRKVRQRIQNFIMGRKFRKPGEN